MVTFEAKAIMNIPANRLIAFGGINSNGDPEEGWETVYLIKSKKGWIPDLVTSVDLDKDEIVKVSIANNPVWNVEAARSEERRVGKECRARGSASRHGKE